LGAELHETDAKLLTPGALEMRACFGFALIPILALSSAFEATAQDVDYQRAEQLLTWNTAKLITGDAGITG
jgi:hypothetical protein